MLKSLMEIEYFIYKLRRTCSLVRVYWNTIDPDWSSIAILMRHQIRRTRQQIDKNNFITDKDRICRQMLIAEALLTRMLDEPYYDIATARYPDRGRAWGKMVSELSKQDTVMFGDVMQHITEWWD